VTTALVKAGEHTAASHRRALCEAVGDVLPSPLVSHSQAVACSLQSAAATDQHHKLIKSFPALFVIVQKRKIARQSETVILSHSALLLSTFAGNDVYHRSIILCTFTGICRTTFFQPIKTI